VCSSVDTLYYADELWACLVFANHVAFHIVLLDFCVTFLSWCFQNGKMLIIQWRTHDIIWDGVNFSRYYLILTKKVPAHTVV